jgi:alpha-tubulin suppressor-like RCC1 family protein
MTGTGSGSQTSTLTPTPTSSLTLSSTQTMTGTGSGTPTSTPTATSSSSSSPSQTATSSPSATSSVVTGENFSCAFSARSGNVSCWGDNAYYQLATTTYSQTYNPQLIPVISDPYSYLTIGYLHACTISTSGHIYCWGNNEYAQVSTSLTAEAVSTPTDVGLTNAIALALGKTFSCAIILNDGTYQNVVYCWGDNSFGQLGLNNGSAGSTSTATSSTSNSASGSSSTSASSSMTPIPNTSPTSTSSVSASSSASPSSPAASLPQRVQTLSGPLYNVQSITAGGSHACALKYDGSAYCWGLNNSGQLGNGNKVNYNYAVAVSPPAAPSPTSTPSASGSASASPSSSSSASITSSPGVRTIIDVEAGYTHTCAIYSDYSLYCWGDNTKNQLGLIYDTSLTNVTAPQLVQTNIPNTLSSLALMKADATCVLDNTNLGWCWGPQDYARLDDLYVYESQCTAEATNFRATPQALYISQQPGDGSSNVYAYMTSLSIGGLTSPQSGEGHGCLFNTEGIFFCWGADNYYQAGVSYGYALDFDEYGDFCVWGTMQSVDPL